MISDNLIRRELTVIQSLSSTNIELITDSSYHAVLGAFLLIQGLLVVLLITVLVKCDVVR
jgi:hypothetical protein